MAASHGYRSGETSLVWTSFQSCSRKWPAKVVLGCHSFRVPHPEAATIREGTRSAFTVRIFDSYTSNGGLGNHGSGSRTPAAATAVFGRPCPWQPGPEQGPCQRKGATRPRGGETPTVVTSIEPLREFALDQGVVVATTVTAQSRRPSAPPPKNFNQIQARLEHRPPSRAWTPARWTGPSIVRKDDARPQGLSLESVDQPQARLPGQAVDVRDVAELRRPQLRQVSEATALGRC